MADDVRLYEPTLSVPVTLEDARHWVAGELDRIARALLQYDIRLVDLLTDDQTGVLTDWIHWASYWQPGFYRFNDMVLDDDWTMIVVNPDGTTDRAAPAAVGVPELGYPVDNFSSLSNPGWTLTANRFTFSKDGWIDAIRVYLPSASQDYEYHAGLIRNAGLPNEFTEQFYTIPKPSYTVGWVDIPIGDPIATVGTVWEVFLIALNNSAPVYHVDGRWQYAGSSQNSDPYFGGWNHNNQHNTIRFHENQAEGLGPAPELADLGADDIVTISTASAQWRYSLSGPASFSGSVYTFSGVTRIEATGSIVSGETCDVEGGNTSAVPTDYVLEANHWAANSPSFASTVQGVFQSEQAGVKALDDNAYGADMTFQEGAVSDDWEVVSGPSAGGGSGGGGILAIGSLGFDTPGGGATGFTINAATSVQMHMEDILVAAPLGITYDLASNGLRVDAEGSYKIDLYINFNHSSSGVDRQFRMGLYNETSGAYLPNSIHLGDTPPSANDSAAGISWVQDIPSGWVGDLLSLRIGGTRTTATYNNCEQSHASISLTRLS